MKNKKPVSKASRSKKKLFNISQPFLYCLLTIFFVLLLDQASKWYVSHFIPHMVHDAQWYPYRGIPVFQNFMGIEFSIVHAINRGAAWGLFADFSQQLFLCRVLLVGILLFYLMFYNQNRSLTFPLTLIVAGAIGNILDHFVYGHVVDMFHFVLWGYHYPVFNVADCAICIGVFSIIFMNYWNKTRAFLSIS